MQTQQKFGEINERVQSSRRHKNRSLEFIVRELQKSRLWYRDGVSRRELQAEGAHELQLKGVKWAG